MAAGGAAAGRLRVEAARAAVLAVLRPVSRLVRGRHSACCAQQRRFTAVQWLPSQLATLLLPQRQPPGAVPRLLGGGGPAAGAGKGHLPLAVEPRRAVKIGRTSGGLAQVAAAAEPDELMQVFFAAARSSSGGQSA